MAKTRDCTHTHTHERGEVDGAGGSGASVKMHAYTQSHDATHTRREGDAKARRYRTRWCLSEERVHGHGRGRGGTTIYGLRPTKRTRQRARSSPLFHPSRLLVHFGRRHGRCPSVLADACSSLVAERGALRNKAERQHTKAGTRRGREVRCSTLLTHTHGKTNRASKKKRGKTSPWSGDVSTPFSFFLFSRLHRSSHAFFFLFACVQRLSRCRTTGVGGGKGKRQRVHAHRCPCRGAKAAAATRRRGKARAHKKGGKQKTKTGSGEAQRGSGKMRRERRRRGDHKLARKRRKRIGLMSGENPNPSTNENTGAHTNAEAMQVGAAR